MKRIGIGLLLLLMVCGCAYAWTQGWNELGQAVGGITGDTIPDEDDTYDLGSGTKEWKDAYIDGVLYVDTLQFTTGDPMTSPTTGGLGGTVTSDIELGSFSIDGHTTAGITLDPDNAGTNDVVISSTGQITVPGTNSRVTFDQDEWIGQPADDTIRLQGATGGDDTDLSILLDGTRPVLSSNTDAVIEIAEEVVLSGTNERITFETGDEYIDGGTDDMIEFQGVSGDDDTDLRIDLDGTHPVIDSPTDTELEIAETVIVSARIEGEPQERGFTLGDPDDWYTNVDHEIVMPWKTKAALTITNVEVTTDADPATELDWDLYKATDTTAFTGETLIVALDTTAGVASISSGWNGTENQVASGRWIYVKFGGDPDDNIKFATVEITFDYD